MPSPGGVRELRFSNEGVLQGTIDILSINVEGRKMDILERASLDPRRPRVVVIERVFDNPTVARWLRAWRRLMRDYSAHPDLSAQACELAETSHGRPLQMLHDGFLS